MLTGRGCPVFDEAMNSLSCAMLFILLSVWPAWAVKFDIWETGISRQTVVEIAQEHDLPLAKDGYLHTSTNFNPEFLEGDSTQLYYQATVYDQPAKVQLSLSPPRQDSESKLYQIEISFTDPATHRVTLHTLVRELDGKYGRGQTEKNSFQKSLTWRPDGYTEIRLVSTSKTLQVTYTDLKIRAMAASLPNAKGWLPQAVESGSAEKK